MVYTALVKESRQDCDEGFTVLEIEKKNMLFYYQAPDEFAEVYLRPGHIIFADIWIVYTEVVEMQKDFMPYVLFNTDTSKGVFAGRVDTVLNDKRFRLDCGTLTFDVNFEAAVDYPPGTNLLLSGSRQVLFPGTEWCYENIGCV